MSSIEKHRRIAPVFPQLLLSLLICWSGSHAETWREKFHSYEYSQSVSAVVAQLPYCTVIHNVNNMNFVMQNDGTFGLYRSSYSAWGNYGLSDCLTGEALAYGGEFPADSRIEHLAYASLWVGAVVDKDTLVSTGRDGFAGQEFHPAESPRGDMIFKSNLDDEFDEFEGAKSHMDYLTVYTDTLRGTSVDYFGARPHMPLYIEVTQRSFAWAYPYAKDFVIVDLSLRNIGTRNLRDVYVGLYFNADVGYVAGYGSDDLCGLIRTRPVGTLCDDKDTLNIAWAADNDGDPIGGQFITEVDISRSCFPPQNCPGLKSAPHIVGTMILQKPHPAAELSFNWWMSNYDPTYDFGPRHRDNTRDFRTGGLGTPEGDRNKYFIMGNGELDYDQAHISKVSQFDFTWEAPAPRIVSVAGRGTNIQYLLSVGPFDILTGERVPLTFAYIGAENFHTYPWNRYYLNRDPDAFYSYLNFSGLVANARNARAIYDNPGVDTDGDGFFGPISICVGDSAYIDSQWVPLYAETTFTAGDGVPDFRGAAPPPFPKLWVTPVLKGLHVRFNGFKSETTPDILTKVYDFEGYNVYLARDDRASSFSLVASYDRINYDKLVWNPARRPRSGFELREIPFTVDSLRCLYAKSCDDSIWHPDNYGLSNPLHMDGFPDSLFYFAPHGGNASRFGVTTPITKVYPEAVRPPVGALIESLDPDMITDEGNLKYYEYQFTVENLLPTVPYWINVTSFDHGFPQANLLPLENPVSIGSVMKYPFGSEDQVKGEDLKVYIYPNPYRIDANYRAHGYEGRGDFDRPGYRLRRIHFANLPAKCRISIYSLDGDLVREFDHDMDPSDPNSRLDEWDMISRNTMEVVSGLYYWVVESEDGEVQMGKLVILM